MLVTEFMEQGDLFRALEADDADRRRFSWYGARRRPDGSRIVNGLSKRVALDVARGLAFLHSRNIVHFGAYCVLPAAPCLFKNSSEERSPCIH